MEGQRAKRPGGLMQNLTLDDRAIQLQIAALAADTLDRGTGLETEESIGVLESRCQHVERALCRNQPQRGRHMPSHPDILLRVAEEVRQRIDHVVAVADEHLSCITLQQPVAQERNERRYEQEI